MPLMWLTKKGYQKHTALDTQTFPKKMTRILTNIEFYKSPQKPSPVVRPVNACASLHRAAVRILISD